jgi:lipoprotein NlpI
MTNENMTHSIQALKEINLRDLKKQLMNENVTSKVLNHSNLKEFDSKSLLQIAKSHQSAAISILKEFPDIFSSVDLNEVAQKFHGAAAYIQFNEILKAKTSFDYGDTGFSAFKWNDHSQGDNAAVNIGFGR